MTKAADTGPRARWPAWTLGLAFAAFAGLSGWLVWRTAILQPYSDQLDWLSRYEVFRQDGDLARYLLTPHNLHRLVSTFLVQMLDLRLGACNVVVIGVAAACLLAIAVVLAREAARTAPAGLALGAGVVAAMLCLGPGALLDAATPIDSSYLHSLLFVVLAIVLAEPAAGRRASPPRRTAALLCAVAAGYGLATGLAVWPVLVFSAWRGGQSRSWIATLVIVAVLAVALYAYGQAIGRHWGPSWSHGGPLAAASLAVHFLGLPWTRAAARPGALIGIVVLTGGLAAVVTQSHARAGRGARIGAALILFSLGAAAMAALGRSSGHPADVPLRYAIFLLPAHVGFLLVALPLVRRSARLRGEALLAAAAGLLLIQQAAMGLALVHASDANREAIAAFQAGDRRPSINAVVHPDPVSAAAIYARLKAQGIYQHELHLKPEPDR
jgi:hypothetical protein